MKRFMMICALMSVMSTVDAGDKKRDTTKNKSSSELIAYHGKGHQRVIARAGDKMAKNAAEQVALAMSRQFAKVKM